MTRDIMPSIMSLYHDSINKYCKILSTSPLDKWTLLASAYRFICTNHDADYKICEKKCSYNMV